MHNFHADICFSLTVFDLVNKYLGVAFNAHFSCMGTMGLSPRAFFAVSNLSFSTATFLSCFAVSSSRAYISFASLLHSSSSSISALSE
jgi:hypothetical protein